jgi:hypothetical protein
MPEIMHLSSTAVADGDRPLARLARPRAFARPEGRLQDGGEPEKPIFVVGVGRSGTTLLRLMLHHHPRIAIPYESHFIGRYFNQLERYGPLDDRANLAGLLSAILDEPWLKTWDADFDRERVLARVAEPSLAGVLTAVYRTYADSKGKERWGDKSDYLDLVPVLNELFPAAQFIHILRDGRDVANSVIKLPWGPSDVAAAASWWNDAIWVGRRVGAVLGRKRYAEVRFEDLVRNPEDELRRLCDFLGEEYSPAMLDYHKTADDAIPAGQRAQHRNYNAPPDPSRLFAWRREMHPCDVAIFTRYAHRMLAELSYEVPRTHVSKLRLGWRLFKIFVRRYVKDDGLVPGRGDSPPLVRQRKEAAR